MSRTARVSYEEATDRPAVDELITGLVGSWPLVVVLTVILVGWMLANFTTWAWSWAPYPFVLINLFLSSQAAYTAPITLMGSARGVAVDRKRAIADYEINGSAEAGLVMEQDKPDTGMVKLTALRTQVAEVLGATLASQGDQA